MFSAGQYLKLALAIGMVGKLDFATIEKKPISHEYVLRAHYEETVDSPHHELTEWGLFFVETRRKVSVVSAPGSALSFCGIWVSTVLR